MAKVWRGEYWKSKKGSPWTMVLLVLVLLWAYGHVNGTTKDGDSAKHGPSASASAGPGTTGSGTKH